MALPNISKNIALPAAAASLAYLDAKLGLSSDLWKLKTVITFAAWLNKLENSDRINMFYILERWAIDSTTSSRVFLMFPEDLSNPRASLQEYTYAQSYDLVLRYAGWLKSVHGIQKGEVVAMDYTNKPAFIWMWFALWSLGAIPAFINYNLRDKAFTHCVRVSGARLVLIDPSVSEVLNPSTSAALGPDDKGRAVEAYIISPEMERSILSTPPYRAPDSSRSGAKVASPAMLIYTSGTTGLPKAAYVSWGKPLSGPKVWAKVLGLQVGDRYMTPLPLYHSSGSILGVCQVLGPGNTIILLPRFSARTFMRAASELRADGIHYIGELCRYLLASPPSPYDTQHQVRFTYGNGMRADVWQAFKDRFHIPVVIEFYGATEAPGASFIHSRNSFLRGTVGYTGWLLNTFAPQGVLVRHDPATDAPYRSPTTNLCLRCPRGETGELLTALDPAAIADKYHGYVGNTSATASKILRSVFSPGDAYYRTGDLQRHDVEGRWWFMDRVGDTFRWKSENVSTAEVSEAVGSHAAVQEANVYGVQLPHHDGRAGCAALVLNSGATILEPSLAKDLVAHVRKSLPRYAVPLFLRLREKVEVTGTHKHQKFALRNEGVDPGMVGGDRLYWLEPGSDQYREFGKGEWARVEAGQAKL